jgi:hypothetical protein
VSVIIIDIVSYVVLEFSAVLSLAANPLEQLHYLFFFPVGLFNITMSHGSNMNEY